MVRVALLALRDEAGGAPPERLSSCPVRQLGQG